MPRREPAICLRTTDYSETSQVVHFLTRGAGKVRLLAKGSKRPKSRTGGAIDLLAEGDLVFTPRCSEALGTLVEFSEAASHAALRKDAPKLHAAVYMIELVSELLADADPHPEVYELLHNALGRLGQADAPVEAVLAYFQWRLLRQVGLLGDLAHCVSCGRGITAGPRRAGRDVCFSSSEGGMLCGGCEEAVAEKRRVSGQILAGLASLEAARAGRKVEPRADQCRAVNHLLNYHVSRQLGKRLKSAPQALGRDRPC